MLDPRARARFRRNRAASLGAVLVLLLAVFALFGPLILGTDPYTSDFVNGVSATQTPAGPSAAHLLGTDRLFRDELARLAHGARLSLLIGVVATVISSGLGALVGIVAGWFEGTRGVRVPWATVAAAVVGVVLVMRGHASAAVALMLGGAGLWVAVTRTEKLGAFAWGPALDADTVLMRTVDIGLSFPFLLLVMTVGAALDRITVTSIFVTLGLTGWLGTARILRAKTLQVRKHDYVLAARALGQSTLAILWRHVLPNVAGPLIVVATLSVAQMIVAESVLSYLGVGIAPPTATWGHMLFEGQDIYQTAPWLLACPAIAILLAVFGFNLLGEGLRDALDPREE